MSSSSLNMSVLDRHFQRHNTCRKRVLRVHWPAHCQETAGWVVGWSISDCICVATVIKDESVKACSDTRGEGSESLRSAKLSSESGIVELDDHDHGDCGSECDEEMASDTMSEPGSVIKPPKELSQRVELLNQDFAKSYWKTDLQVLGYFDPSNTVLRRVKGYGFGNSRDAQTRPQILFVDGRFEGVPSSQQVVLYNQPAQNEMYCDMFEWKKSKSATAPKLKYMSRNPQSTEAHAMYMASLHQINTSRSVEWMLTSETSPLSQTATKEAALKAFESVVHSHYQPILWLVARTQVAILTLFMWILQSLHWGLNRKLPIMGRLAEYGLMGGFLDKRLVILLNYRDSLERMKTMPYRWQNDPTVHRAWLRFYNTCLSMLLDSILGLIVAYIMWTLLAPMGFSHDATTQHMTTLWGYEWLKAHIRWIMVGAPAGLKLNLSTVQALGSTFLFYIEQWSIIVRHLAQLAPLALVIVTFTGALFGLSMQIILVHDIVYFVNMHIYWLYAAITRLYNLQLTLLRSLWLLFRGKKANVLKQRIDSCNAHLDQLIVGTLLFAALIFLLPTTALYYAFFVYAMSLVLLLQAAAQVVVNILNYSPIYSLLLLATRSRILTGGIHFISLDTPVRLASSTSTTALTMLPEMMHNASYSSLNQSGSMPLNSPRPSCTYFQLCSTFVSPSVVLVDFNKTMTLVRANYQLSKLIDCFVWGNTWQNKRFQPNRLKVHSHPPQSSPSTPPSLPDAPSPSPTDVPPNTSTKPTH